MLVNKVEIGCSLKVPLAQLGSCKPDLKQYLRLIILVFSFFAVPLRSITGETVKEVDFLCGARCHAFLCSYHGHPIDLKQAVSDIGVDLNRGGVTATELVCGLRKRFPDAKVVRMTSARQLQGFLPCILYQQSDSNSSGHFSVLLRFDDKFTTVWDGISGVSSFPASDSGVSKAEYAIIVGSDLEAGISREPMLSRVHNFVVSGFVLLSIASLVVVFAGYRRYVF